MIQMIQMIQMTLNVYPYSKIGFENKPPSNLGERASLLLAPAVVLASASMPWVLLQSKAARFIDSRNKYTTCLDVASCNQEQKQHFQRRCQASLLQWPAWRCYVCEMLPLNSHCLRLETGRSDQKCKALNQAKYGTAEVNNVNKPEIHGFLFAESLCRLLKMSSFG